MRITSCTVVLFTFLMITAEGLAETAVDGKDAMVLAVPEQSEIGQPFLVRLTSVQAFDKILICWMDREFVPSLSQWNGNHVAIAMLGTDVLTIKPERQKFLVRTWATGPHLHLSISVQGQLVDPVPLFEGTSDQLLR